MVNGDFSIDSDIDSDMLNGEGFSFSSKFQSNIQPGFRTLIKRSVYTSFALSVDYYESTWGILKQDFQ